VTLISRDFFARHSVQVAPDLLGCVIEHQTADGLVAVELTEVEAYAGESDPASHAYRGKTRRNAVMFGPPGHAYVYFTYGMHFCVNLVCLGNGSASAVLLRAGAVIEGEDLARARRARRKPGGSTVGVQLAARDLARGPARLCQALDIDRSLDGADVCVADSPLRVRWPRARTTARSEAALAPRSEAAPAPRSEAAPAPRSEAAPARGDEPFLPPIPPREKIASGPRVGVSAAAEVPWRFWIDGEPSVSVYRPYVPRRSKLVTP
jgi:DNA-3-methyladenine glycosylase